MIDNQELPPTSNLGVINKEAISSLDQWAMGPTLRIEQDIVAAGLWEQMTDLTQRDKIERGVIVGWNGKQIFTSKIFKGTETSFAQPAHHDFMSMLKRQQDIVSIHTHYISPEEKDRKTDLISDIDINAFLGSTKKAIVMVHKNSVHMLARIPYSYSVRDPETDPALQFEEDAVAKAKANTGFVQEAIEEMAKKLKPLGLRYYYSPNLTLQPNGLLELADVLKGG